MPTRKDLDQLTDKQLMFVAEYLVDLNATQAAIRAGYSPASAEVTGCKLLSNPKVGAEVERRRTRRLRKLDISAERVLQELHDIAFSRGNDAVSFGPDGVKVKSSDELTDDVLANISEVSETVSFSEHGGENRTIRVKHHDKMAALRELAKYTGVSRDRFELTGAGGGPIEVSTRSSLESKLDELGKRLGGDGSSQSG